MLITEFLGQTFYLVSLEGLVDFFLHFYSGYPQLIQLTIFWIPKAQDTNQNCLLQVVIDTQVLFVPLFCPFLNVINYFLQICCLLSKEQLLFFGNNNLLFAGSIICITLSSHMFTLYPPGNRDSIFISIIVLSPRFSPYQAP